MRKAHEQRPVYPVPPPQLYQWKMIYRKMSDYKAIQELALPKLARELKHSIPAVILTQFYQQQNASLHTVAEVRRS